MAPKDTIYYDLLEVKVDATPIEYVSSACMQQNLCTDRSKQAQEGLPQGCDQGS